MTNQYTPLPTSKLGEYTVIDDIGEGTFGKVKLATHAITGHRVAMKYLSKAVISRDKNKSRVKREFEYLRALRHPHIVKLYEVISTPTDIIFVMEFAGGELFNHIVSYGSLPEAKARRFFQQLISGLEYSHRLKIVHRDLKLENVLIDDDMNLKIADFGLSAVISDGSFLTTSCGSPNYAAPEVLRGGMYAGPEIDVWSAGVILYVMLCGKLPFEDENVQILFHKIHHAIYHLPGYLSQNARSLIHAMLTVDPIKRISIPDIMQHPFFTIDLPTYLKPLPTPGPILGPLSTLVTPPKVPANLPTVIEGFGAVEEDTVDELATLMVDVTPDDIWECLRRDDGVQGNAVKVAYLLLRDKKRIGKDLSLFAEQEREAQLAAMDPRNALSPNALSPGGGDLEENPFDAEFNEEYEDGEDDEEYDLNGTTPDGQPTDPNATTYAVLLKSLPPQLPEPHHLQAFAASKRHGGREKRQARTKWHFGIRSQSPPMEVMLEIYRTLKSLGMEWKEKKSLGGLGGVRRSGRGGAALIERVPHLDGEGEVDMKAASEIYLVETRARVQDVVILMNLQLYMVDPTNYLVDFHHKKSYRASTEPGAGRFDMAIPDPNFAETLNKSNRSVHEKDGILPDEETVMSPYVFMDVACQLIFELAAPNEG